MLLSRLCAALVTAALLPLALPGVAAPAHAAPNTPAPAHAALSPVSTAPSATALHASSPSSRPPTFAEEGSQQSGDLVVSIDNFAPRVLTDESTLVVSGTVSNHGRSTLPAPTVQVFMQATTPVSMEQMAHFFTGLLWNGPLIASESLTGSLAPGESRAFTVTVDRASLPLEGQWAWGPRGVTVEATAGDEQSNDRSLIVWDAGQDFVPSRVNVVVPWTVRNAPLAVYAPAIAGQLQSRPGVTLAVDPEAVDTGDEAMSGVVRERLLTGTHEVIPLLPFDADPGLTMAVSSEWIHQLCDRSREDFPALLASTAGNSADGAQSGDSVQSAAQNEGEAPQSAPAPSQAPTNLHENGALATVLRDVRWPSEDSFGLEFLAKSSSLVTLAPAGALPTAEDIDFLPAPRVEVDPLTGQTLISGEAEAGATVLTSPAYLSDLLGWGPSTVADNLDRDQLLAAAGAIITRERPQSERSFLAVMPRRSQLSEDAVARLRALTEHRWVAPTTLSEIAASPATDIARIPLESKPVDEASLQAISVLDGVLERAQATEAALSDPQPLREELTRFTFEALSASYEPRQRQVAADLLRVKTSAYSHAVHAEPSAPINVISTSVNFPVRVVNSLPWEVRVRVDLDPSDRRMRVVEIPEVTIPAHSARAVEVPVKAIGSGDINVTYKVLTVTGTVLDNSHSVSVRLRAEWEDAATMAVATVVGIAFVGGLIRTLRRRMRASTGLPGAGGSTPTDEVIPVSDASPLSAPPDTLNDDRVFPTKDEG